MFCWIYFNYGVILVDIGLMVGFCVVYGDVCNMVVIGNGDFK